MAKSKRKIKKSDRFDPGLFFRCLDNLREMANVRNLRNAEAALARASACVVKAQGGR